MYLYVQGYCEQRNFIAAQTPMYSTEGDVWEMIWMETCAAVVVLCDGGQESRSVKTNTKRKAFQALNLTIFY